MPTCRKCHTTFPNRLIIEGVVRTLCRRKYCLGCSPYGQHNTRILQGDTIPDGRRSSKNAQYVANWHRKAKLKAVEYKGGGCELCGYKKSIRALCFHHIDPTQKDFGISTGFRKWESLRLELDKCQLLCMNCHAEQHDLLDQRAGDASG